MSVRRSTGIAGLLVAVAAAVVLLCSPSQERGSNRSRAAGRSPAEKPGRPVLRGAEHPRPPERAGPERQGVEQRDRVREMLHSFVEARDGEADALARELIALGAAAVPVLIEALGSESDDMRAAAAILLGHIGAEEAIPHLVLRFEDEDEMVRDYASEALGRIGKPALPALVPCLGHPDGKVRARAAVALWNMHEDAKGALPEILEALERERHEDAFQWLSSALVRCGPEASAAIPHLVVRLSSPSQSIASNASDALGEMGQAALAPLIAVLRDTEHGDVAAYAAFALRDVGEVAAVAIPALLEALQREDSHARRAVCDALGAIGQEPATVVPALAVALTDRTSRVREHAARALRTFGADAAPAIPGLLRLLTDEDEDTVSAAVLTLGAIGPQAAPAVPFLLTRLSGGSWGERASAMTALRGIGPAGHAAAPILVEALDVGDLRAHAATALYSVDSSRFQEEAERVVPALLAGLNRLNQGLRVSALNALASLGMQAADALPGLRALRARCQAIGRGERGYQGTREEVAELLDALDRAIQAIDAARGED